MCLPLRMGLGNLGCLLGSQTDAIRTTQTSAVANGWWMCRCFELHSTKRVCCLCLDCHCWALVGQGSC